MKEIIDDEDGYIQWLKDNQNGYVINSHRTVGHNTRSTAIAPLP